MSRRAISNSDVEMFVSLLRKWDVERDGALSWVAFIARIESEIGYAYERTTLYKAKCGVVFKEFGFAKERLRLGVVSQSKGSTMSRQSLLKAYAKQCDELERLRNENTHLLQLHLQYMQLFFKHDIIPKLN